MIAERKRILLLALSLDGGGAERFFCLLLQNLDRNRFEPHLGLMHKRGEYLQDLPQDVIVHNLGVSRSRWSALALARLVWRIRPHAVLSTLSALNVVLLFCKPFLPQGTRLLVRQSISSSFLTDEAHPQMWKWLYRMLYPRADRIICLYDSMMDDLAQHFHVPREKMVRIYNAVDVAQIRKLAEIGEDPYRGPGPHLVAAGRFWRQKGFDLLLAAMPAALEGLPGAQLTILGEGPLRGELREQADKLGLTQVVHFLGFQRNPWPYLRYADLFVLSSRYEGLPNILLEALALGTPVVATDCPGAIREVLALSEGMALVPPEDPAALARGIIDACRVPRQHRPLYEPLGGGLHRLDLKNIVEEYSELLLS